MIEEEKAPKHWKLYTVRAATMDGRVGPYVMMPLADADALLDVVAEARRGAGGRPGLLDALAACEDYWCCLGTPCIPVSQ